MLEKKFALINSPSKFDFLLGRRFFRSLLFSKSNKTQPPDETLPPHPGRHGVQGSGPRLRHRRLRCRREDPTPPSLPRGRRFALRAPCSGRRYCGGVGIAGARMVFPAHHRRRFAPPALLVPQAAAPACCSHAAAGAAQRDEFAAGGISAPTAGYRASFRSETIGAAERAALTTASTLRYAP
jgi:hypothetical protein